MKTRYYLRLPDPTKARGSDLGLAFHSEGADGLAGELQQALRGSELFERWRSQQEDPEAVDAARGVTEPQATERGEPGDQAIDLVAPPSQPRHVFKQRLRLLAGSGWELRDVTAG
jgi:hypothetical protein